MDETQVAGAIQGIGHIARTLPESTAQCLNALMACIKSPHGRPPIFHRICYGNILNTPVDCVVANAVVELKSLVQTQMQGATHAGPSSTPLTIVERLAYRIDEIRHAQARACIVWLVGQYAADDSPSAVVEGVVPWAPDVLRKIAKSFRDEARVKHAPPISRARSHFRILFFLGLSNGPFIPLSLISFFVLGSDRIRQTPGRHASRETSRLIAGARHTHPIGQIRIRTRALRPEL